MNDLEICKRIAEIEGVHVFEYNHIIYGNVLCYDPVVTGLAPQPYNPLTDDALCFQLMVKYKLEVWEADGKWLVGFNLHNTVSNESPNKAILLAIIEAHKDL